MRNYESKLVDSSRLIADMMVEDIGNDEERFGEMLDICFRDEYPLSMRASRIVALAAEREPSLITPHITSLVTELKHLKIDGVKRGFLKMLAEQKPEMSEDELGLLTDLAFMWLSDSNQPMAVRYYCIEILREVCKKYPELVEELKLVLDPITESESSGLRHRAKEVLRILAKNKTNI